MLTTTRRDQRNRRQALFTLESLDDRLVLSATAAGAAVSAHAAAVEARHDRIEARHEARLDRIEARHEAKLAKLDSATVVAIPISGHSSSSSSAKAAGTSAAATTTPAATTTNAPATTTTTAPTTVSTATVTPTTAPVTTTTTTPGTTTTSTPLPSNVASALQSLYSEYESQGSSFTPSQPSDKLLNISGDDVEVSLNVSPSSSFSSVLAQLQSDGMQVSASSATYGQIDGMLPIAELTAASALATTVNPIGPPQMR